MAKLSARGRTEIARFKRTVNYVSSLDNEERSFVEKRALMSDNRVLVNKGFGWTVRGKLRPGVTAEKWIDSMNSAGVWERTNR